MKNNDIYFGWGAVLNFQKKANQKVFNGLYKIIEASKLPENIA